MVPCNVTQKKQSKNKNGLRVCEFRVPSGAYGQEQYTRDVTDFQISMPPDPEDVHLGSPRQGLGYEGMQGQVAHRIDSGVRFALYIGLL